MKKIISASEEIFDEVFCGWSRETVLKECKRQDILPQDFITIAISAARKCGFEVEEQEAFAACCFELGIEPS